jgi:hypothetical protein
VARSARFARAEATVKRLGRRIARPRLSSLGLLRRLTVFSSNSVIASSSRSFAVRCVSVTRLMPMRSSMRSSAATPAFRSGIACCTATAQRTLDDAGKFHQQAVAGGLDDAAMVLGDFRIEELPTQHLEAFERAFLVRPHQPRIPRYIGGEDYGETALDPLALPGIHGADATAISPSTMVCA